MEAYHIDRFGSVDGIVFRSSEDPRPGLKEVLMRVRASSFNYRDLMVLKGGGRGPNEDRRRAAVRRRRRGRSDTERLVIVFMSVFLPHSCHASSRHVLILFSNIKQQRRPFKV